MRRIAPIAIFLIVAALGAAITYFVHRNEAAARLARFQIVADDIVDAVSKRVQEHITLISATAAFRQAMPGPMTRRNFADFVDGLDLADTYEGIQGIGYAIIVAPGGAEAVQRRIADGYAIDRPLWPEPAQALRTAIVYLEPANERNLAALGFDMFSEARRREAMSRAMQTGRLAATAPVTLVQEITAEKQAGFLIYLPVAPRAGRQPGFVYAAFRAGDLLSASLKGRVEFAHIRLTDRDAPEDPQLFMTDGFRETGVDDVDRLTRTMEVGGRTWMLDIQNAASVATFMPAPYTAITGVISLLLAVAMAAALWWQMLSLERARALEAVSEKSVQEKDLMLQEMKHRIKNSIARILAMARQTAASSTTIDDFSASFTARLQSMANAQEMLTRAHWARTDLRELLVSELRQVFGAELDHDQITGPAVLLDGKQVQSLGLTFHELATNALKYGAAAEADGELAISWHVQGKGAQTQLVFAWVETAKCAGSEPMRHGFGSRLMEMSIQGELSGTLERRFTDTGLTVLIRIPLPQGSTS